MMKPLAVVTAVLLLVWACAGTDTTQNDTTAVNDSVATEKPADSSTGGMTMYEPTEMALLMRGLFDSVNVYKQRLEAGETPEPTFLTALENIHGAELTKPEIAGPQLTGFTNYFMEQAEALATSHPDSIQSHYTNMVNACIDCHKPFCPGPIVRINKLKLAE